MSALPVPLSWVQAGEKSVGIDVASSGKCSERDTFPPTSSSALFPPGVPARDGRPCGFERGEEHGEQLCGESLADIMFGVSGVCNEQDAASKHVGRDISEQEFVRLARVSDVGVDVPAGVCRADDHLHATRRGAPTRVEIADILASPSPAHGIRRIWASMLGCKPEEINDSSVDAYLAALREEEAHTDGLLPDEPLSAAAAAAEVRLDRELEAFLAADRRE